jgi:DNA-binding SARP family transcriptional activator/TolB-like protein/tetratricopeptide (TPR) repeat protein
MYSLRLLGAPALRCDTGPITGRPLQRHRLALLALIGSSAEGMPRERVLAYLWPESPSERARASLNESVYVIRKALGEEVVLNSATELRLNPSVIRVDAIECAAAVQAGDWEVALRLYGGPFLDGFFLGAAGEFDRWAESERARLAQLHRRVLERLARCAGEAGDWEAAVDWWRKLAGQDLYDARIARGLMEALAAAGNRAGALEHARVHAALLKTEFQADPDPEVAALAERIRTAPPSLLPGVLPAARDVTGAPISSRSAPVPATAPTAPGEGSPPRPTPAQPPPEPSRRTRHAVLAATVLLLLGSVLGYTTWERARGAGNRADPTLVSLAVLPFQNIAARDDADVLEIGVPDAIITRLATIERMRVRPTSAILSFTARSTTAVSAGEALAVEYVLTGTIQASDDRVRVNVQLVRVSDGIPVWGEHFEAKRTDLLAVQDEVSASVATALRVHMSAAERERLRLVPTRDAMASELYMRGRAQLLRRTEPATRAAAQAFEEAIGRDPNYALAHAGLALASAEMHLRYPSRDSTDEWGRVAMRSAHRALDLDPRLGEAHEALAAVFRKTEFDWHRTIEESRRAIALNPSLEGPHHYMAGAFFHLGLLEEADRALDAAEAINPTGDKVELLRTRGMNALWAGRFGDAVTLLEEAHRRSDRPIADWSLALASFYAGEPDRAESTLRLLIASPSASASTRAQATLASFLAARGVVAEAEQHVRAVVTGPYMDHHVAYSLGVAYAQLGLPAESVRWLREAAGTGFRCYPWFVTDPLLGPLGPDAGFQDLLTRLKDDWHRERSRYRA